jgi:hypothetical protein
MTTLPPATAARTLGACHMHHNRPGEAALATGEFRRLNPAGTEKYEQKWEFFDDQPS